MCSCLFRYWVMAVGTWILIYPFTVNSGEQIRAESLETDGPLSESEDSTEGGDDAPDSQAVEAEGFDEAEFMGADGGSVLDSANNGLGIHLHGSFENQLTGFWPIQYDGKEHISIYDYVRLRVDLDADLPGKLELRSDVVVRLFVGETELKTVNLIPKSTIDALIARDPRFLIVFDDVYQLENEVYLDNAYLKIPIHNILLTLGKQPLEQGAGYVWNPTDVFTEKDMLDPTYEKPGDIAIRLLLPFGDIASLDLMAVPDGSFNHWSGGGRLQLRIGVVSVSAVSYYTRYSTTDYEGSMDAMEEAVNVGDDPYEALLTVHGRRVLAGGEVVLDIEGIRIWGEGAYNDIEKKNGAPESWWELTSGLEYYFPFQTHVMMEYYHYGRGPKWNGEMYDFNGWMGVLSGDLEMLGRDFFFESIDHPVGHFWNLGFSSFQSVSDGSVVVIGDVRWEFVQDAELWLMIAANIGNRDKFLSASRGQGWLRLNVFF